MTDLKREPFPKDTLFLVTEAEYDQKVMRAAIAAKYEGPIDWRMVVSSFNMTRVPHIPQLQIVVCSRIITSEDLSPGETRERDAHGDHVIVKQPPSKYVKEVVFSPPIAISKWVQQTGMSLASSGSINLLPLIDEIAKYAMPYRILPENPPNEMCRMLGVA